MLAGRTWHESSEVKRVSHGGEQATVRSLNAMYERSACMRAGPMIPVDVGATATLRSDVYDFAQTPRGRSPVNLLAYCFSLLLPPLISDNLYITPVGTDSLARHASRLLRSYTG